MAQSLAERYSDYMVGVLSCFDRRVITGTLPGVCYAAGMTGFLNGQGIRIFDYTKFAEPLREQIRSNAQALAQSAGIEIEYLANSKIRKEAVIAKVLEKRGEAPGLVHIISAMESCASYQPWHDKKRGQTYLKPDGGKCLHYYFYFIDAQVGLCYLRVPTWAPFRLQFYCNGHGWLARKLTAEGITFTAADNAFIQISDVVAAQRLADALNPKELHRRLDHYARKCCPVQEVFHQNYHWSLMQVEYSTDLIFRSEQILGPLYDQVTRQAVLAVKAADIATFLGKKITPQLAQEIGSRFSTRIEGTCLKHRFGKVGVKMYDKFRRVLRVETTVNDVSFFKHHRKVEHKNGPPTREFATMKKTIYSLNDLREVLAACNPRYLEYISALEDTSAGERDLKKLTEPKRDGDRNVKGLNFFDPTEQALLRTLQRAEFNIKGIRRANLVDLLPDLHPAAISRQLKRLRVLKLIKRTHNTYCYYLTRLGRAAIAAACSLTQSTIVPALAHAS